MRWRKTPEPARSGILQSVTVAGSGWRRCKTRWMIRKRFAPSPLGRSTSRGLPGGCPASSNTTRNRCVRLGSRGSEVANPIGPDAGKLHAFHVDFYVVGPPARMATLHNHIETELWTHARIRINQGKTQLKSGTRLVFPIGCEHIIATGTAANRTVTV